MFPVHGRGLSAYITWYHQSWSRRITNLSLLWLASPSPCDLHMLSLDLSIRMQLRLADMGAACLWRGLYLLLPWSKFLGSRSLMPAQTTLTWLSQSSLGWSLEQREGETLITSHPGEMLRELGDVTSSTWQAWAYSWCCPDLPGQEGIGQQGAVSL